MNIRARGTDRLLDVLDYVATRQEPCTRNAIATALAAPRSTIYSVIDTLVMRGYLDQATPDGMIVPGRRCSLLGLAYDRSAPLARQAREVVADLARQTGEVVELDVLQDWKQLILISRSGQGYIYRGAAEGTLVPLPCTASGRFLLEDYSGRAIEEAIPAEDFVVPTGGIITVAALQNDIAQASRQGYWITRGLVAPHVACIAAPVRRRDMRCIGAICLVLPLPDLAARETEYVRRTRETADQLSSLCALVEAPAF